jgi:ubiquinone/menaquinone biosynthesis C-methylase UbiE
MPALEETHWEQAAKTRMGKYLTQLETCFLQKTIDQEKNHMVVDVGAEAGRFSLLAANSNTTVVGIDIDAYSLRRLKQKNRDVIVIQADARKIPLKDGSFDAIFMIEVLDYIPQISEALSECNRVLKPGSSLVLSFGNKSSLKAKIREIQGKSYLHSYRTVTVALLNVPFQMAHKMGYSWVPFGRSSDNPLIPMLVRLEKIFGLRRIVRYSPWVIIHVTKCM